MRSPAPAVRCRIWKVRSRIWVLRSRIPSWRYRIWDPAESGLIYSPVVWTGAREHGSRYGCPKWHPWSRVVSTARGRGPWTPVVCADPNFAGNSERKRRRRTLKYPDTEAGEDASVSSLQRRGSHGRSKQRLTSACEWNWPSSMTGRPVEAWPQFSVADWIDVDDMTNRQQRKC